MSFCSPFSLAALFCSFRSPHRSLPQSPLRTPEDWVQLPLETCCILCVPCPSSGRVALYIAASCCPPSFPCLSLGCKSPDGSSCVVLLTVVAPVSTMILAPGWCLYHLGIFWLQVTENLAQTGCGRDYTMCLSSPSDFFLPGQTGLQHFPGSLSVRLGHATSSGQWALNRSDECHSRLMHRRVGGESRVILL